MAEELQVNRLIISAVETGKSFPGFPLQDYLNDRYHLNINWLINGSGEMIIPLEKKSASTRVPRISSHLDENDPMYEKYTELNQLLCIPVIEQIILAKLEEAKLIAAEEIKAFLEKGK